MYGKVVKAGNLLCSCGTNDADLIGDGTVFVETKGRPLGIEFDPKDNLIIADNGSILEKFCPLMKKPSQRIALC